MKSAILGICLLGAFGSSQAQVLVEGTPAYAPPLLQIAAGTVGSIAGGFAGAAVADCDEDGDEAVLFCGLGEVVMGGMLGYSLGNVLGVSLVGKHYYGKGYWLTTILGNIAGGAIAIGMVYLLPDTPSSGGLRTATVLLLIPALTTGAFHLRRNLDLQYGASKDGIALQFRQRF